MALNTTTLETNLNTKMNATTGTTEGKEFLLLGKAVEALTPTVTVNSVIAEGDTQVARVTSEGTTQVAAVQAAGSGYVTQADIDTSVSALVDSSPATLNTLNELAAALGDDANFSTTVTNSIATKLPLAGGTMTSTLEVNPSSNVAQIALTQSNVGANGDGWKVHADGPNGGVLKIQRRASGTDTTVLTVQTNGQLNADNGISGSYTNLQPKQTASSVTSSHVVNMNEPLHIITMTGATNFTFSNVAEGKITMIKLYAPSSTPPSFSSDTKWPDATEPTWADYDYWLISVVAHSSSVTLASASGYTV